MSLKVQIKRYAVPLAAIVALMMCAAAVGTYVLQHQRLRFPWEDVYTVKAEFQTAQAVTPGQGQNVTVAGVTVGDISKVTLDDGRAVVTMEIDPHKLPAVYRDATMLLRPKTGLKDMSVALEPGTPKAGKLKDGERLPVGRTNPDVNPDEVLAALDADTRTYLAVAINEGGRALSGRGADLRDPAREPAHARDDAAHHDRNRRPPREAAPPHGQPARAHRRLERDLRGARAGGGLAGQLARATAGHAGLGAPRARRERRARDRAAPGARRPAAHGAGVGADAQGGAAAAARGRADPA
jgi:hypothetical protein